MESVDYPDFGKAMADAIASGKAARGVLTSAAPASAFRSPPTAIPVKGAAAVVHDDIGAAWRASTMTPTSSPRPAAHRCRDGARGVTRALTPAGKAAAMHAASRSFRRVVKNESSRCQRPRPRRCRCSPRSRRKDPAIDAVLGELYRQREQIELIALENTVSRGCSRLPAWC